MMEEHLFFSTEASCTKCSPKNARNRILQEFAVLAAVQEIVEELKGA